MDLIAIIIGSSWTFTGLQAWFAINRFGGKRMIIWSIPIIGMGIISFLLPLERLPGLALTLAFAPLIFVLIPVLESWRFARQFR